MGFNSGFKALNAIRYSASLGILPVETAFVSDCLCKNILHLHTIQISFRLLKCLLYLGLVILFTPYIFTQALTS